MNVVREVLERGTVNRGMVKEVVRGKESVVD